MKALIRDLLEGWRAQPGRLLLAGLAIGIGVLALTILLAVLGGLQRRAAALQQELGARGIVVLAPADGRGPAALRTEHAERLRAACPALRVAPLRRHAAPWRDGNLTFDVLACDPVLPTLRPWRLVAGGWLDEQDLKTGAPHAVASSALARQYGLRVGDTLTLRHMQLTLVGLADLGDVGPEWRASALGDTPLGGAQTLLVPLTTSPHWLAAPRGLAPELHALVMRCDDETRPLAATVARIQRLLAQPPDPVGADLRWLTSEALLRQVRAWQRTVRLSIGSIVVLCLLLGGCTLMSLMVANVQERIPEIGLRRALGARPGQVAALFLAEAALTSFGAGCLGLAAAALLLRWGGAAWPVTPVLTPAAWLLPPLSAVGLGLLFAAGPAWRAARLIPAQALRND